MAGSGATSTDRFEVVPTKVPADDPTPVAVTPVIDAAPTVPAAVASSVTTPTVRLTGVFDRIGHWLSGLPASPVTDYLSGALLMVRRSLLPGAAATQSQAAVASSSDGTGPVVTDITSTPGSTSLVLTFDGPLIPGTATDLANYSITAPSWRSPEFVTSSGRPVRIVDAQYADISESSSQVTLTLARRLNPGTFYRIFINGELPITNGNPDSNPLTGADLSTFDGDNDETPGGNFYGLFATNAKRLSFKDSYGDRVTLSASGGGLNVWRELNGDIDQITVLPGSAELTGSVVFSRDSTGTVSIGSLMVPAPNPLNLNGATDNLPPSFQTVPAGGETQPPPMPTEVSPKPVVADTTNLPYTINISPVSAPGIADLPAIQAGVYAHTDPSDAYPSGLWVVFGGRTNGLHNFPPGPSFPPSFQNNVIYVINPVTWQVWSKPWSQTNVPTSVYSSLSSTNQASYQKNGTLYVAGGYSVPGTVNFTGSVTAPGKDITVTSGVENLAVGQFISGITPYPAGQDVFPDGTTIAAINGNTVTASDFSEVDAIDLEFAAYTSDFKTYDTLTALDIEGLAQAVINGGDIAELADIRQISDPRVAVAGGDMAVLNGRTYLTFGHDFQGSYTGDSATISQVYSSEVRSFRIVDTGRRLAIANYRAQRDPVDLRRRDGNLVDAVGPFGRPQLAYLGGVFTPGSAGVGYRAPVRIAPGGRARPDASYQQYFSQYTTSHIPLFDTRSRSMYQILIGGISLYSATDGILSEPDTNYPWIDNVTSLVRSRDGSFQEYMMSPIPAVIPGGTGFYGANSAFFTNEALPTYRNNVIQLSKLSGPTVLGYMYGGIYSTVPNTSTSTFSQTTASNQVFQITLTPTQKS